MSRSLPPNPCLGHLKNEAKALRKAHKAGDRKVCGVLRRLNRLSDASDAAVLVAEIPLKEVQFALAMDYGFRSWNEMKEYVGALEAMRSGGLPLADGGDPAKWGIVRPDDVARDGDAWVFTDDHEVWWEVGGMSWDNYVLDADVRVRRTAPDGTYRVQLTGRGTCIYCQLVPGCVVLAYYDELPEGRPRGFTHLARREVDAQEGVWIRFRMKAESGTVTAYLDGREIVSAAVPSGTQGMPGLLVNGQKHAVVHVRDIRVEFLRPTPEQLAEYRATALENWSRWAAVHGTAMPDPRRGRTPKSG